MIKRILQNIVAASILISCQVFAADTTVSASSCNSYLQMSDSQFASTLENPLQAQNIASILTLCLKNNICASLNNIDQCAIVLANRTFLADYSANRNNNNNTNNNAASPMLQPTASVSQSQPNTVKTVAEDTQKNTDTTTSDPDSTEQQNNNNIKWF